MRRRPWPLVVLAILHFIAPIGNVIFNALIARKNVMKYLVFALSPQYLSTNWVIIIAPIVAGVAIYACKKWSFYVYLFAITALFIFSYSGYVSKAGSISLIPVIVVYLINIGVVTYFLIPAVRNVYFDRRLRWWEIQARYKCNFKCHWQPQDGGESHTGVVGNISENGLFLRGDVHPLDQQKIKVTLPFNDGVELSFNGVSILHNRSDAIGFGVKFEHSKESRKQAKQLVADLEEKGMRISSLDSRPEDSFSYWIRNLITTGRGWIPKKDK